MRDGEEEKTKPLQRQTETQAPPLVVAPEAHGLIEIFRRQIRAYRAVVDEGIGFQDDVDRTNGF